MEYLQWPAMFITVLACWFVAAQSKSRRKLGFWCYLVSNALWIAWGLHDHAYALVALQVALAILNLRGANKNSPPQQPDDVLPHGHVAPAGP